MSETVPVHAMKTKRGGRGMALLILNLSIRWRQIVNFYTQTTLPPEKEPTLLNEENAVWAPLSIWTFRRQEISLSPAGS